MTFVRIAVCASLLALGFAGCHVSQPQGRLESTCVEDCKVKAKSRCREESCIRGCRFVLDRLMEREGPGIVSCVATGKKAACDDEAWATCAVNVGIHADGGPPAPVTKEDE